MANLTRYKKRPKSGDTPTIGEAIGAGLTRVTNSNFGAKAAKKAAEKDIKAGRVTTKAKQNPPKDRSRMTPTYKKGGVVKKKGKRY